MSVNRYLFLLIAIMLLLIGIVQLTYISMVRDSLDEEIGAKSQALSDVAVQVIQQRRELIEASPTWTIDIAQTPHKEVQLDETSTFVTGDKTLTVTLTPPGQATQTRISKEFFSIDPLNSAHPANAFSMAIGADDSDDASLHVVQFPKQDSVVYGYMTNLLWITGALLAGGLLFALWLAKHISQPLTSMSGGYQKLAEGELGTQLPVEGVKEMRETLETFNSMSSRLVELDEMANQFQQQQQLAELGDVARGLAHALRSPLHTIGLAIDQMAQPNMDENKRQQLAKSVREQIQRFDSSIKNLLHLSNQGVSRNQDVRLLPLLNDLKLSLSFQHSGGINIEGKPEYMIKGAESEVRAMLHALLSNAVEAAPSSPVNVEVKDITSGVKITITDQGAGVSESLKGQLFQPHVSSKAEGAGMGLFITKRLATLHYNGDVLLENASPTGCKATLTLHHAESRAPV